jgi:hypothetical protein
LVVADEVTPGSGTYTKRDVTTAFAGLGVYTGQDGHTITADGLTIIARSTDSKRLVSTKRSAINMTDFGPASTADFDAINAQVSGNAGIMFGPAISADGLQLFYSVSNIDAATNGIYTSIRNNTMMPFPAGVRATSPVQDYALVSGISSDRLALFMFDSASFSTKVLTRTSTSQPFTNPNAPGPPPMISSGWQHKPLMDCSKLLAMVSPGGCGNEDIALFTRQ